MKRNMFFSFALGTAVLLPPLHAQSSPTEPGQDSAAQSRPGSEPGRPQEDQAGKPFTYHVNVTERTTQAVDYRDRGGTTQVDFKGTALMPAADGRAKVTGHTGRLAVAASFHHLEPATSFGPEYLTYVLWAITPEGRPMNLGEVVPQDGHADVQVTSNLQEFGMILTAEPYFAVTRPSDVLVAENIVRADTEGGIHAITARYELLQRGQYTVQIGPADLPATSLEHQKKTPLQILEAENAIAIAQASGAGQYAGDTLQKAQDYLAQAQEYQRRKQGRTPIGTVARAAAQTAEDARLITLEKKQQEQVAAERQRAQDRIQQAQSDADREAARASEAQDESRRQQEQRALADQERQAAEQAKQEADRARVEAQQATQQAEQEKAQAQQQLQQADAAHQAALQQQQALSQQAEQERAKAQQQADQSRLQAQQAEQAKTQAEQQTEQMRQRLLQQLNQVLQTRDTAKGLIVNVSDVLFDTGKSTLKPGARVRLAKVSGIILAYPDLKLEVDGYTDSTGTAPLNQRLSERRADAVQDFLVSQGVPSGNVSVRGFGSSDPIASNGTATGRQLNRRVEMVVSGSSIGNNGAGNNGAGNNGAPGSVNYGATPTGAGGTAYPAPASAPASADGMAPSGGGSSPAGNSPGSSPQPSAPGNVTMPNTTPAATAPGNTQMPASSPPPMPPSGNGSTDAAPAGTNPPPPPAAGGQPPQ